MFLFYFQTSAVIPSDKSEPTNGTPTANFSTSPPSASPTLSLTHRKDLEKDTAKEAVSPKEESATPPSSISTASPYLEGDEIKENVREVVEDKREDKEEAEKGRKPSESEVVAAKPKQTPSGDTTSTILKPLQSTKLVPQVSTPMGRSTLSPSELDSAIEKVQARILEGLAAPVANQKKSTDEPTVNEDSKNAEATDKYNDQGLEERTPSAKLNADSPIPFSRFDIVTRVSLRPKRSVYTCKFQVHIQ